LLKRIKLFYPSGKSLPIIRNHVKPLAQKYSAFHVGQITGTSLANPAHTRGRFAIVTMRWAGDAVDAFVQARKRGRMNKSVRRSRVVLAPRRWR
jgi:hypothetical protein